MKSKMTKAQIRKIKAQAKSRKNRRLNSNEHLRLMSQAKNILGLHEDTDVRPQDGVVIEDGMKVLKDFKNRELIPSLMPSLTAWGTNNCGIKPVNKPLVSLPLTAQGSKSKPNKIKSATTASYHSISLPSIEDRIKALYPDRKPNTNRRLTKRQYESLMKKATAELGINDNEYEIINDNEPEKPKTINEHIYSVLTTFYNLGNTKVLDEYNKIVEAKRYDNKDKLSILNYVVRKPFTPLPMCMIPKGQKTNTIRKILKTKGDVIIHPPRELMDEDFLNEISGRRNFDGYHTAIKKGKKDYFDTWNIDKKIEWARYANLIAGISSCRQISMPSLSFRKPNPNPQVLRFAMEYACKLMKVPVFKGQFSKSYWIQYRIQKYHGQMLNSEYDMFMKMTLRKLGNSKAKTIPPELAAKKVITFMGNKAMLKKYAKLKNDGKYKYYPMRLANDLIHKKV